MALQKQPAAESKACPCIPLHVSTMVTGITAEPEKSIENRNIWSWGFCSFRSFKQQAKGRGGCSTLQGKVLPGDTQVPTVPRQPYVENDKSHKMALNSSSVHPTGSDHAAFMRLSCSEGCKLYLKEGNARSHLTLNPLAQGVWWGAISRAVRDRLCCSRVSSLVMP